MKLLAKISKVLLVSLFGLSQSCIRVMYGSPYSEYEVKGRVLDEEANPVKGIEVALRPVEGYQYDLLRNVSEQDGTFVLSGDLDGSLDDRLKIIFNDADGVDNGGQFASDSVFVDVRKVQDGDGWLVGSFVSDDVEIVLKKEEK